MKDHETVEIWRIRALLNLNGESQKTWPFLLWTDPEVWFHWISHKFGSTRQSAKLKEVNDVAECPLLTLVQLHVFSLRNFSYMCHETASFLFDNLRAKCGVVHDPQDSHAISTALLLGIHFCCACDITSLPNLILFLQWTRWRLNTNRASVFIWFLRTQEMWSDGKLRNFTVVVVALMICCAFGQVVHQCPIKK